MKIKLLDAKQIKHIREVNYFHTTLIINIILLLIEEMLMEFLLDFILELCLLGLPQIMELN
jgi:hypothetical protein